MKSTWCFSTMITYTILCSGLCVMKSDCKHWTEDVSSVVEDCIVDWYFCFCQTFRLCERSLGPVTDSPTFYEVNIYLNCIRGRKQYVWDLHFKQKSKYLQSYNLSLMIFFFFFKTTENGRPSTFYQESNKSCHSSPFQHSSHDQTAYFFIFILHVFVGGSCIHLFW